jgi:hypothetical protein
MYCYYFAIWIMALLYGFGIYDSNIITKRIVISILTLHTIAEIYVFIKNKYF